MDMSPGQRKAVFALIVLVLAGLGVYLVGPRALGARPASAAPPRPAPTGARPTAGAAQPPAAVTGARPAASAQATPDIYQWLPFSESDLGRAATMVIQFGKAYGTWSFTQNATEYAATMNGLATQELTQYVAQGYSVPGVASLRTSDRQVSSGTAVINSLRAFGPSSLTFLVTISQEITGTGGSRQVSGQYAITVTGNGSAWQVSDIELATAGNS